jgi:diguanylate cyclase (GGDEF)-like protein
MRKYLSEIRYKKKPAAVLCVGLNQIDTIIDLQGEAAADAVIAGVADVIQRLTRDTDLIGRYHRDDFIVLAPCSMAQGEQIAVRLRETVQKEPFLFEGRRIRTTISVGISAHPEHGRTLRDLFQGAYTALTVVRSWKTSSCLVYDPVKHHKKGVHEPAS